MSWCLRRSTTVSSGRPAWPWPRPSTQRGAGDGSDAGRVRPWRRLAEASALPDGRGHGRVRRPPRPALVPAESRGRPAPGDVGQEPHPNPSGRGTARHPVRSQRSPAGRQPARLHAVRHPEGAGRSGHGPGAALGAAEDPAAGAAGDRQEGPCRFDPTPAAPPGPHARGGHEARGAADRAARRRGRGGAAARLPDQHVRRAPPRLRPRGERRADEARPLSPRRHDRTVRPRAAARPASAGPGRRRAHRGRRVRPAGAAHAAGGAGSWSAGHHDGGPAHPGGGGARHGGIVRVRWSSWTPAMATCSR